MEEIIFKNGSYIYILSVPQSQTKRPVRIVKENHPIEFGDDEYCNALLNVFKNILNLKEKEK